MKEEFKRPSGGWNFTRATTHPGEMLFEEFMKPLGLSANKLAIDLRIPVTRISEIIKERRSVTADTALRLARYFGMSAEFWMNMQALHDLTKAKCEMGKKIKADVKLRPRSKAA